MSLTMSLITVSMIEMARHIFGHIMDVGSF